ncbi:MAG: HlyD family efflux transporter periplasmic adaptor subunit [Leptolyngbya sp. SIO4C1]|nr:HlyD family efflux transporter periplasmic adaptor subunit [Leptolyngbya sp. SIO4C1]
MPPNAQPVPTTRQEPPPDQIDSAIQPSAIQPSDSPPVSSSAIAKLPERWSESLQSVLDQPPSALPKYLILGSSGFAIVLGIWAWFGTLQEVSRAQGRLMPQGKVYKVQSVTTGEVARLLVQEGDRVEAGQVVAELDRRMAQAEVERLLQTLDAYRHQYAQTQILIDRTRVEAKARQAIAMTTIQSQLAEITESQANAETSRRLLRQLNTDVSAYRGRLERLYSLLDEGAISMEYLFEVEQSLRDRERALTENKGRLQQVLAQTEQLQAGLAQRQEEFRRVGLEAEQQLQKLTIEAADLSAKIEDTATLLEAAQAQLDENYLYAPISGTVSSRLVDNTGEVIQIGQTVLEVAPADTPLILSALLPSREAGLVSPGMPVQMKFDAFPYQSYGIVSGEVLSVSPDAKTVEQIGPAYEVEIALEKDHVIHEQEEVALRAGQTANAEIVIKRRRIIDLLLDPIRQLQKNQASL